MSSIASSQPSPEMEENIVWRNQANTQTSNISNSKLIGDVHAVVEAGELKVGMGTTIHSFARRVDQTKFKLSTQKFNKSPGKQFNQAGARTDGGATCQKQTAEVKPTNIISHVNKFKEHVAAIDNLVLKLKEVSLQKEMGGADLAKTSLRAEIHTSSKTDYLPTTVSHFASFWITLAYLEKGVSNIERVMMEGFQHIVGEVEVNILNTELLAVRSDLENSGFVKQIEDMFTIETIPTTQATMSAPEVGIFPSSPIYGENGEDGVAEEFGGGRVEEFGEDPIFEKKTERSLFATSSDVLKSCIASKPVQPYKDVLGEKVSGDQEIDGCMKAKNVSYTQVGDVLTSCLSTKGNEVTPSQVSAPNMMPPPPSRLVTTAKATSSVQHKNNDAICLKRLERANQEVEKFNQKKARLETDATTPRRSQRVGTSRDTPRYK